MASFRNRNGKWQARVVRKGQLAVAKSFLNKQDAERWARQLEVEIDRGTYINVTVAERTTFGEIIQRYIQEVTINTRSAKEDTYRLKALARHWVAKLSMVQLTPSQLAAYRDERLQKVSPGAVIRELSYFSSIINHARREWGINISNPVALVRKPPTPMGRNKIITPEQLEKLVCALKPRVRNGNIWVLPLVQFALESAMRRGEMRIPLKLDTQSTAN